MTWNIQTEKNTWEIIIGLEVHAQILTQSKLFSAAPTNFGANPNNQVNLLDAAMPGTLPVCNQEAITQAVRTALALNANVHQVSIFERKNYFYPDLPQGYQISQFQQPLATNGNLEVQSEDGNKIINIERLHIEQDAGKSLHDQDASFVDLNRAGIPLMEIVSHPDIRSPKEAASYLRRLRSILRTIKSCDGNMNEGSMRCDINLSIRIKGETKLGTRTETKNVNSVRFVTQAIELEAKRQVKLLEAGGKVQQETRLFDAATGRAKSMRSKEEAHDYRYFPDPDLLPLVLDPEHIEKLRQSLPELPQERAQRFIQTMKLNTTTAAILTEEPQNADYFEALVKEGKGREPVRAANWVVTNLFSALNESNLTANQSPVPPDALGELLDMLNDNTISGLVAKEVFEEMWSSHKPAREIVAERGLEQISDQSQLEEAVKKVLNDNESQVQDFLSARNEKVAGWFIGQVMKATQGKANPQLVNQLVRDSLQERKGKGENQG
ncbi:MAG: Asp-tRNA(Asn)/Glu-tRNA(Gln) amidotransferase subunit GatB [Alphaproteobacteria bacterium]